MMLITIEAEKYAPIPHRRHRIYSGVLNKAQGVVLEEDLQKSYN